MSEQSEQSPDSAGPLDHASVDGIEVLPILGIGELRPGDDLGEMIAVNAPGLRDGDILVVTSKAISKIEGRLVPLTSTEPLAREAARQAAITDETVRVVAERETLRIVQTRHGLVIAAAGVDLSNVSPDEMALLPVDPDASAAALRDGLRAGSGSTSASSSATRPDARGGPESPTTRSESPV